MQSIAQIPEIFKKQLSEFISEHISPYANSWDVEQKIPVSLWSKMAQNGYLGIPIPKDYGGLGLSAIEYGYATQEIGSACSSVRSLLTVHTSLSAETIFKWGTEAQKKTYLPKMVSGETLAAFALTEPNTGSDAKSIESTYVETADGFEITGHKKWITFGQIANLFVVCATGEKGPAAFLIDRNAPGLKIKPMHGILGTRASMLAELHFDSCKIEKHKLLGRMGFGFMQIVNTALDNGRFSVAWGSVGIAKAALKESITYAKKRQQFGDFLKNHQLIQQKISKMATHTRAAQMLCIQAANLRQSSNPDAFIQTSMAKYLASENAQKATKNAVQIHGAIACQDTHIVQRLYRDAKIMTIIEGSSEMQELLIADYAFKNLNTIID